MGVSYRPDNPFAQKTPTYSPDNPFAPKASSDTGDIDLRTSTQQPLPKAAPTPEQPRHRNAPAPRAPGNILASTGTDYLKSELQRGGASLAQQARDVRGDAKLHGAGKAALHLGGSLAEGIVAPILTLGQLLGSPEDEMAGTPDSERKTGLQAYNRETDRLSELARKNARNNQPGELQDETGEDAAREVRQRRLKDALVAPIATAGNFAAPGVFKAVEKAALPIAERVAGKLAGGIASRVIGESAAGAVANAGYDPTHPISAGMVGAGAGAALGEAGHAAGKVVAGGLKGAVEGTRKVGEMMKPEPEAVEPTVERRAAARPEPSEMSPTDRAAYREQLVSERQRLSAYAGAEPDPTVRAAYTARHARLGEEIKAIDAASPETPAPFDKRAPGQVSIRRMNVNEIVPDPTRFQYKQGADTDTGAGGELKGLSKYDEQLAGVISVWRDPKTGIFHPINGHNRLALAQRTGHPSVNVQEINARTAPEARAQGALANIAEGRGTPLDAATFFRETGLSEADLRDRVSFKGMIAKRGMAISKLAPDIFGKVATGKLPESHAAAIGEMLPDSPEMQRTAVAALEKSHARLSESEVRELARQINAAGTTQGTQETLFGNEGVELPLWIEKAKLASAIQRKLAADRRLFGYVAKEGRAEGLARAGNVIDVEGSRRIADESAKLEEVFSRLYTRAGPIADALHEGARRLANGEGKQSDIIEQLYPAIQEAVQDALGGGAPPSSGTPGIGNQDGQSEAGYDATGRQVAGSEENQPEGRALDSTDPNQSALLSPWGKQNRVLNARPGENIQGLAAARFPDGSVWIGGDHAQALTQAHHAGIPESEIWDSQREDFSRKIKLGVIGRDGRFVEQGRRGPLLSPEDFNPGELGEPQEGVLLSPGERQPSSGPERLVSFAIKAQDGTLIEGRSASDAHLRAARAGHSIDIDSYGFITSHGRFVPEGREAIMLAYHADQLRRNTSLYRTLSQGAIPFEVQQYGNESKVRGVGGKGIDVGAPPKAIIAGKIEEGGQRGEPALNPWNAVYVREQARKGGQPLDPNNPDVQLHIVSRAIKFGTEEHGEVTQYVESFVPEGVHWMDTATGRDSHVVEGYQLSDGSFITREEAKEIFPDADFGPEGRDENGPLFSPEKYSPDNPFALHGEDAGEQQSFFAGREGTAASRNLSETERHASGELARLKQAFVLESDASRRAGIASDIAQYEKLLNRNEGIGAEEMRIRAIANEESKGAPPEGPDQGVLFSPASQPTQLGAWYRRVLGIRNSVTGDVVALRKISVGLAEALDVPLREGRGNLKRLQALGAFWKRDEVIRVRRLKALDTVAHEIGHYLSKKYDLRASAKMLPAADRIPAFRELLKMGHDLYGNRQPAGGYAEEGVAQWARFMVTDRQRMVTEAPHFTRYMDTVLQREPALRDILNKAHDDFALYQSAPANAKIASMIEQGLPSRLEGLSPETMIDHWFNDLKPIRRAVEALGKPTSVAENAANLAELTKGNAGRARDILDNGVIDFNTRKRVTRGFREILKEIGAKNRDEFTQYMVSKQVLTKTGQGIDTGFDVEAAKEVVAKGDQNPAFVKAANDVWAFRSALLDYLSGAGLMTAQEVQGIRKGNPTPTPFYRSFADDNVGGGGSGRSVALAKNSAGVFRMKGSDRPILDPLQSIVHDTYTMVDRAQKHYAATVLIKSALETEGGGHIAQLLPEIPMEARRVGIDRVREQLIDAGWTPPDDPTLVDAMGSGMLEAFYQKSRPGAREIRDQVLPILIDGERKWVQINDQSTWEALEGMSVPGLGVYERILTAPTRTLRMGATQANPDFALINPLRDAFPAAIYSAADTHLPGWHLAHGIAHILKSRLGLSADALVDRWAQEGGENAGMIGADKRTMTKEYIRTVREMTRDGQTAFLDHLTHPIKTIREQFEIFENATRVGEFAAVRSERMKAGMPEIEASVEAAYSARNVTQDFFKAGRTARIVNRYVPFFAAQLGDIYKMAQEFNPANFADPAKRGRAATVYARAVAYVTIPSITLYLLQKSDPDYQEIPEYYKANSWVIVDKENGPIPFRLRSGKQVRVWAIPRPYLIGYTFGYMPEKMLAWAETHDPRVLTDMAKTAWSAFSPSLIPTIAGPLIENYANRSLYSDKSIVPRRVEGLATSEQSQAYTGEAARLAGKKVGYSPAKIENVVRGYSGGAGMMVTGAADAAVRKGREFAGETPLRPAPPSAADPLDHAPVIGRFVLPPPGSGSKSVSQLFQDYDNAEQKRQTWRAMLNSGRTDEARQYLADNRMEILSVATEEDAGAPGELRQIHKALGDITQARRAVAAAALSPEERTAREAELEQRMVKIARGYYKRPQQAP